MKISLPKFVIVGALGSVAIFSKFLSPLLIDRKKVERRKNLSYGKGPAQRLDLYLPRDRTREAKYPVSLLIHGGGFRFFSKESHAVVASRLAASGRIVFCIDYRVAPKNPFPDGLCDALHAYTWMIENAEQLGGDLDKISLVGESSGANFVASLCLYLFGIGSFPSGSSVLAAPSIKPRAAVLHCGFFQVSNLEHFRNDPRCFPTAQTRIVQIREQYLPARATLSARDLALADPLATLDQWADAHPAVPSGFPECFVPVGATDPVIGDSERFARVLARLGQTDRLKVYPGVGHAFYAGPSNPQVDDCWADLVHFLGENRA